MLGHKPSVNRCMKNLIKQSILLDHHGMKLESNPQNLGELLKHMQIKSCYRIPLGQC